MGGRPPLQVQPDALIKQATRECQGAGLWNSNICVSESLIWVTLFKVIFVKG